VLEENLDDVPHLQGPDRSALAATAVEELEGELLILDDGFQHRRLHRDLDMILADAADPFGGGRLFPRGLLREPPSSLRRASAVVLTRCDQASAGQVERARNEIIRRVPSGTPVAESDHRPVEWRREGRGSLPPDGFRERDTVAFCGIGSPEAFRRTAEQLGARVTDFRTFPDHHGYTRADVDDLRRWAASRPAETVVLTTQKDAVKLRLGDLADRELWSLRIGLALRPGPETDALHAKLDTLTAGDRA
jgi:tetraacyldisaccharide 4'-kinase